MKIASLRLSSFLGAPDGDYVLGDANGKPKPLVLVRGGARSGKTSFLQAIATVRRHLSMVGPPPSPERGLARGARRGEISATWILSEEEARMAEIVEPAVMAIFPLGPAVVPPLPDAGVSRVFAAPVEAPAIGKVMYLGADRRWPRRDEALAVIGPHLPSSSADFAGLPLALCEMAVADGERAVRGIRNQGVLGVWEQHDSLEPLRQMLVPVLPHLRLEGARRIDGVPEVLFARGDGEIFSAFELSSGEQAIVLMTTIFFLLKLSHSVVLIDEPERSIAPAERAGWLRAIQSFGADNQIIIASDAPELEREIPRHQQIVLGGGA
jgi:hypothetical protein